jgi:DNA-binding response OmpR family regulator
MQILVIDDDGRFRQMLRTWLVKQGHDVHDAADGPQALELLRRIQYDVVTLDLMMPKANGQTSISEIRRFRPETHIIVVSAEANTRVAVESIKLGAEAFLEKPVDFGALENELARLAGMAAYGTPAPCLSLARATPTGTGRT